MRDRQLTPTFPRLAFRRQGAGGAPVLLLMGFGMPGSAWEPQTGDLARDHQLVVVDNRGVGASPDPPGRRLTMRDMAEDAARVLDACGLASAHVVGISMGGMIAQELALCAPERVRSLSLIATHPGGSPAAWPRPRALYLLVRSMAFPRRSFESLCRLLYPREYVAAHRDAIRQHWRSLGRPAGRAVLLAQAGAIARHDTRRRLAAVRVPTLVVRPGRDILIPPRQSDRLARAIPLATLLRFDDAGHGVHQQKARELNAALRAHIEQAESAARTAAAGG